MRTSIHHHYEQLTERERDFVDTVFGSRTSGGSCCGAFFIADKQSVPLAGDDRIERAVDALARAVIESRQSANG